MKMVLNGRKRKAISPVLATVILIAITLIAAIAIAGFVFGLFGSFTSSAQVQASVVSCTQAAGPAAIVCTLNLTNSGSANTALTGTCSVTAGGITTAGTTALTSIIAGTSTTGTCTTGVTAHLLSGSQATGSVLTTNGASVPFTGTMA